ncbi:hypothetical protein Plhal304r1_c086g0169231 [Plasmopara halstedii]
MVNFGVFGCIDVDALHCRFSVPRTTAVHGVLQAFSNVRNAQSNAKSISTQAWVGNLQEIPELLADVSKTRRCISNEYVRTEPLYYSCLVVLTERDSTDNILRKDFVIGAAGLFLFDLGSHLPACCQAIQIL